MLLFFAPMLWLAGSTPQKGALPDLARIFIDGDRAAFSSIFSHDIRVLTDLRPLLFDHGNLSDHQALISFEKLLARYEVLGARVANSQSDANYAWLELYLELDLRARRGSQRSKATFAFYFKMASSRLVVSRWALQDVL